MKKLAFLSLLLTAVLLVSVLPVSAAGGVKGDVTGDGVVDAADLTRLARHVARIELLTSTQLLSNADVTRDGSVDAADLTKLARYVARIITTLDDDTPSGPIELPIDVF